MAVQFGFTPAEVCEMSFPQIACLLQTGDGDTTAGTRHTRTHAEICAAVNKRREALKAAGKWPPTPKG